MLVATGSTSCRLVNKSLKLTRVFSLTFMITYYSNILKMKMDTQCHYFMLRLYVLLIMCKFIFLVGRDWHAPPPIPTQQAQQNLLPRSNYTSLKRPHSNMVANSDRKSDSPKEMIAVPKPLDKTHKSASRVSAM